MSTQVVKGLLHRTKFEPATVGDFGNAELLEQANKVLGYTPRAINERATALARRKEELVVAEALEKLGVEPLDRASVERYKQAKIDEAKRHESCAFVRYMHRSHSSDINVPVGKILEQEWSALIHPATKADILDRVDKLARAIKRARSKANDVEVETGERIGRRLLEYVFEPLHKPDDTGVVT